MMEVNYNKQLKSITDEQTFLDFIEGDKGSLKKDENGITLLQKLIDDGILTRLNFVVSQERVVEILYKENKMNLIKEITCEILNKKCNEFNINYDGTLIEFLINNNYEFKFCGSSDSLNEETYKTLNRLCERKEYSIILNSIDNSFLYFCFNFEVTLLDILLQENISVNFEPDNFKNKFIIGRLFKHGKFDLLAKVNLDLLLDMSDGKTSYLDYLMKAIKDKKVNYDFDSLDLTKYSVNVVVKFYLILIKYDMSNYIKPLNHLYLFTNVNLDSMLTMASENSSYLDYFFDAIKTEKIKLNLAIFNLNKYLLDTKAKFYITLAKHGMIEYIEPLQVDDLLKKNNGITLLDKLLQLNKDLTIDILSNSGIIGNIKIATILKSKGININLLKLPLKDNFQDLKIGGICDIGPLPEKGEKLLEELKKLFLSDGKSDKELIELLVNGYRQALIYNYDIFINELQNLVDIKINNPKFKYIRTKDKSHFSSNDGCIYCRSLTIAVIMHETGHALHFYMTNNKIPENFSKVLNEIRNMPEILTKTEQISKEYYEIKTKLTKMLNVRYKNYFKNYYNADKIKEIDEFLSKTKEEKKEEFKNLGISENDLDIILSGFLTIEEYIKCQKRIFMNELLDDIVRRIYSGILPICDILDGILEGKFVSGLLINSKGEFINSVVGHGIPYYFCDEASVFKEMIAQFSTIIKSDNAMENLEKLNDIIGDELYDLLSDFYFDNIICKNINTAKSL